MKPSSGFTKTGFSKSGFSCCSKWQFCQMGYSSCFYEEEDPEIKSYCRAFQRKHFSKQKPQVELVENVRLFEQVEDSPESKEKILEEEKQERDEDFAQLSLF